MFLINYLLCLISNETGNTYVYHHNDPCIERKVTRLRSILTLTCGMFILLLSACRKSDYYAGSTITPVNEDKYAQINLGLSYLKNTPLEITVIAGTYTEVRLPKGTKLKFYTYSFTDADGKILSGDTIKLSVLEMYGAGAAIANRCMNLNNNQLLTSGGTIRLKAQRSGGAVNINKYGVCFYATAHSQNPMNLYYGNGRNEDSTLRWTKANPMSGTFATSTSLDTMTVYLVDTTGTHATNVYRNYYIFDSCTSLNWVGCNYPYRLTTSLTNIAVTPVSSDFTDANTAVFLVFPDINAVIPVSQYDSVSHTFSLPKGLEMPSGMNADLVAIGYNGSNLYYYENKGFKLGIDMALIPILRPYTVNEILNMLYLL